MANVPGHEPSMTPLKFCIVVLNIVLLPRESEREGGSNKKWSAYKINADPLLNSTSQY